MFNQYAGAAFHPDFDNGRRSGMLSVVGDRLVFTADEVELSLPLNRLEIKMGGAGKRLVYFSDPGDPEVSFYTSEKTILRDPALSFHPLCSQALGQVRSRRRKRLIAAIVLLGLVVGAILTPFFFADALIRVAADQVPFEWEAKLGSMLFTSLTEGQTFVDNPALLDALGEVTGPLVAVVQQDHPEYQFEFHIIEDPTLNAFALPGGKVVIHSGLLLAAERPEEVAGVLAHEISHVTCRHHLRSLLKRAGITVVLACLIGDAGSVSNLIISYGGTLALLKNSRTFEYEADATGWEYLRQAHIDPQGMIIFFERLQEDTGEMGKLTDQLDFLSTHPATADRIKVLEEKNKSLPAGQDYYHFEIDYAVFKEQLQNAMSVAVSSERDSAPVSE